MVEDSLKIVVRKYVEAFNNGDGATLQKLFTPDAVIVGVQGEGGLDFALPIWRELHESLRCNLRIEELVREGDTVVARYTETGTMVGAFRGQRPTGKSFTIIAMEWFQFRDGLIAKRWGARDASSIARQIGMKWA